jgi:hypothetical protein
MSEVNNTTTTLFNDEQERFDRLGPQVHRALKYYVYLYKDPRTGIPFYVGKGVGDRMLAHHGANGECEKGKKLNEIRAEGVIPQLVIVRHGMTESEALAVEAVLIEHIGLDNLTNKVAGHKTDTHGRMTLAQVRSRYAAEKLDSFDVPALLFRITRSFRYTMTGDEATERDQLELYEATRGTWNVGSARNQIQYAMAVYDNVIQEIYVINGWHLGGTHTYTTRPELNHNNHDRYEFTGERCKDEAIREKYIGKDVKEWFPHGFTGPFRYCWPSTGEEKAA